MHRIFAAALAFLAVSACATGPGVILPDTASASVPPTTTAPQPPREAFRPPAIMSERGLDSVIGARASALTARFGTARIDLTEGDARKLQFAGQTCVLDIFLYPLEAGREPVATHVEVRRRSGAGEIDRARCIAEIESR
ncbi:MAG: hypothetical protein QNJ15_01890 [Erythrobacter sp.]|nr:hypothetical protein [Erythrobacter sp.]